MNKEAKRDGDYVSYSELFRLVQAGRRELGLPEYKRRSSLHFALVANRIPAKKVNCRKKIYHAPTALQVLCPGTAVAAHGGELPSAVAGERWVTLGELYRMANSLRSSLRMPLLKSPNSCGNTLRNKNVPRRRYGSRNYYWQLEPALRALTRINGRHPLPRHRTGTAQELASGEFMPLVECARMLRCSYLRLLSAAGVYSVLAFRHPHTNMLWVRVKDAERVAYYRTASFLFRHLPEEEVHYIMATRPFITHYGDGVAMRVYYVPELSPLGACPTRMRKTR